MPVPEQGPVLLHPRGSCTRGCCQHAAAATAPHIAKRPRHQGSACHPLLPAAQIGAQTPPELSRRGTSCIKTPRVQRQLRKVFIFPAAPRSSPHPDAPSPATPAFRAPSPSFMPSLWCRGTSLSPHAKRSCTHGDPQSMGSCTRIRCRRLTFACSFWTSWACRCWPSW